MSTLAVSQSTQERFHKLVANWKAKSRHLSNVAQISMVFSYQSIIGMGPEVVPLILAELDKEPDHWFWALEAITGENPVGDDIAGDMEASAKAWLQWGRKNGLLTP